MFAKELVSCNTFTSSLQCNLSLFPTASMTVKRITTEEEAKAALAERRRLAREQAEREAELERQRLVSTSNFYLQYFWEKKAFNLSTF